jgi:hypothetical protein
VAVAVGSNGSGGSGGSGGSSGSSGHPYAGYSGRADDPHESNEPDRSDGQRREGGSTYGGPGGAGDLQPGQTGQGPGGAMEGSDAVRRIGKSVENMGRTTNNVVDDAANEGPSGSY